MTKLTFPVLIINMKTYSESLGKRALELARVAEKVSKDLGVCIAVCPQYVDLRLVAENVDIPVLAQHADTVDPGAHTGHVTLEAVKDAGAIGTLVNHSERRLRLDEIRMVIEKARRLDLVTVVCAATAEESGAVAILNPAAVAVEPPELIGTGRAVSREKPEVITRSVDLVKKVSPNVPVLCGAGVESGEDVKRALELGAQGVLVASAIVKAPKWEDKVREMALGLLPRR